MKSKMKNRILATVLILTLMLMSACSAGGTAESTEGEKLQAPDTTSVSEEISSVPAEGTEPTTEEVLQSTEDLTGNSKPTENASATEPTTAHTEQPTTQTQLTAPPVTEPPHQHSYSTTVISPTCSDKGYTKHTCACGNSYNDTYTAALGHHYIDEVIAPTSSAQGYTKHTCDRCGYSYNDTYTDPVKVVYDINAAMEAGNAYALSIGFACIDYSLTPANAGYYPCSYITGDSLSRIGGQRWLEQEVIAKAQSCKERLIVLDGDDGYVLPCRAYITYDSATDTYCCYFLYA